MLKKGCLSQGVFALFESGFCGWCPGEWLIWFGFPQEKGCERQEHLGAIASGEINESQVFLQLPLSCRGGEAADCLHFLWKREDAILAHSVA